jgi:hypothetical protein
MTRPLHGGLEKGKSKKFEIDGGNSKEKMKESKKVCFCVGMTDGRTRLDERKMGHNVRCLRACVCQVFAKGMGKCESRAKVGKRGNGKWGNTNAVMVMMMMMMTTMIRTREPGKMYRVGFLQ